MPPHKPGKKGSLLQYVFIRTSIYNHTYASTRIHICTTPLLTILFYKFSHINIDPIYTLFVLSNKHYIQASLNSHILLLMHDQPSTRVEFSYFLLSSYFYFTYINNIKPKRNSNVFKLNFHLRSLELHV